MPGERERGAHAALPDNRRPPRWWRRILGAAAGLTVLLGAAWLYLTAREPVPAQTDYRLDVAGLRTLAASLPGPLPTEVRSERIADASLPRAAVFAGDGFAPQAFVHQVFQVRWADGGFVLIDTGFPPEFLARMQGGTYYAEGYARVLRAMAHARAIVVTHEHFDHLGGVSRFVPADGLAGRLQLTAEQLANTAAFADAEIPAAMRQSLQPLGFARATALAPGVVLQKAPGHTPGSILIYVRTEANREYLFVGDVAWHTDQLRDLHYRPRLVTDFFLHEDRAAVLGEFRALYDLMQAHPEVAVVVSHDPEARARLLADGGIRDGLAE